MFYHLLALASRHWVAGPTGLRKIVERKLKTVKTCPLNLVFPRRQGKHNHSDLVFSVEHLNALQWCRA